MNIAIMSHDRKKELMVQFCTAYSFVLAKHTLCGTEVTGKMVADATGLDVKLLLPGNSGGAQQIGARIPYNEIDLVLALADPQIGLEDKDLLYIINLCDQYNVPCATNLATAEMLVLGLDRGDLDWRAVMNPKSAPFIV